MITVRPHVAQGGQQIPPGAWSLQYHSGGKEISYYYPTYEDAQKAIFAPAVLNDLGIRVDDIISITDLVSESKETHRLDINLKPGNCLTAWICYRSELQIVEECPR